MQSSVRLELSEQFFTDVNKQLEKLEFIVRSPTLEAGVKKGLNKVKTRVRQILPKPGYPGDKPGLKALRDTVSTKVDRYREGRFLVGTVGYEWGAGSHGHIVEHGHRMVVGGKVGRSGQVLRKVIAPPAVLRVMKRDGDGGAVKGRVEGKFYLQKAVDSLGGQIESTIVEHIQKAIAETEQ